VQGCLALARGRNAYLPGALCESEPAVQDFWLSCVREMLDDGVDGIEFRVENHSSHTDTPEDYGFNQVVLDRVPDDSHDMLADISRVRGEAYTRFLRRAKQAISTAGRKMRVNLNVDWFRPPEDRPRSRKLAYPANIDFDWSRWVGEGLLDEAMLRPFGKPFASVFDGDEVARDMVEVCAKHDVPVTVNRYVWCNAGLLDELKRALHDGRFSGFVLYETWSFMGFTPDGECGMVGTEQPVTSKDSPQLWQRRAETSTYVQQVCRYWRGAGGNGPAAT